MVQANTHTLRDFTVPIALYCFHCERKLSKSTPVQINSNDVIAYCQKCGCMSIFKIEAA